MLGETGQRAGERYPALRRRTFGSASSAVGDHPRSLPSLDRVGPRGVGRGQAELDVVEFRPSENPGRLVGRQVRRWSSRSRHRRLTDEIGKWCYQEKHHNDYYDNCQ